MTKNYEIMIQKSMLHTEMEKQSRKTVPEEQILDILEKRLIINYSKYVQRQKKIIFKDRKENMKIMSHQIEHFKKKRDIIFLKKYQIVILEFKHIIIEKKKFRRSLNSIFDKAKERTSECMMG